MDNLHIPPQLELPRAKYSVIRNGSRGIVFRISKEYAGKILFSGNKTKFTLRNDSKAISDLEYEAKVTEALDDRGFWVPKPVGIELLSIFESIYPVYIMEYIPFPTGAELGFYEFEKARRLALNEIKLTMDQGFNPGDDCLNPNNYFYDKSNEKICLVDFEFWKYDKEI